MALQGKFDAVLYGLAQMGVNLLDNMARNGNVRVIGVNRTVQTARDFQEAIAERGLADRVAIADTMEEAARYLRPDGMVFAMIKAFDPRVEKVDHIGDFFLAGSQAKMPDGTTRDIAAAVELLPHGFFIDLANSHPESTYRRMQAFRARGLGDAFLGTGVSGGSEGALEGPSIMPGGSLAAYRRVGPLLEKIAAKFHGQPCCAYLGDNEAGHFVKNIHNGVEYNIMGALAETYMILRTLTGATPKELQGVFSEWKEQGLGGYLLDITCDILGMEHPDTGKPILDVILDEAGSKGTGKWTSQVAYDLGVAVEGITAALNERIHSGDRSLRASMSRGLRGPTPGSYRGRNVRTLFNAARDALYASMIVAYAQGFAMFTAINQTEPDKQGKYDFSLDLPTIANIWRAGCIVRAELLPTIAEAYADNPELANMMLAPKIASTLSDPQLQQNWRYFVTTAIQNGLPRDSIGACLNYYDNARTATSVAAMLQAQRDYFGEHGFGILGEPDRGKANHLPLERPYAVTIRVRDQRVQ